MRAAPGRERGVSARREAGVPPKRRYGGRPAGAAKRPRLTTTKTRNLIPREEFESSLETFASGRVVVPDVTEVLERQPWDSLTPHLLKAGADAGQATARLRRYTELLLQWNRGVSNLVSRNDESRIVERHIAESIEPAHWLKESGASRWLDFGSGGGLPALPLALVGVGSAWTLVESRRTKTLFIRKALQEMGIEGVRVVLGRLESLVDEVGQLMRFDGFTSRATLPLGPTLVLAAHWVEPGGSAFLWKGSKREAEMASDRRWEEAWDFDGLLGIGQGQSAVARFRRR